MVDSASDGAGSTSPGGDESTDCVDVRVLVGEHYRGVYRYAYRLCGSEPDAEDLTQQTFLLVQDRLHQLRERDKAQAWIYAILRSCFFKSRRRQRPVVAANLELEVDAVPDQKIPDAILDKTDVQQALNELPDEFRIVVLMFYYEELSYLEIAERLALPIGTVMSRLSRAKSRLRQLLFADDEVTGVRPHAVTLGSP